MTLASNVTARYSAQFLKNITNPNNTSATTIDTTRLGLAATDIEADFEITAGVEYDDSDSRHVSVGCEGVIARCLEWGGHAGAETQRARYDERIEALAHVTGRNRILPQSASVLEPTVPQAGVTHRPDFDDSVWDGLEPGRPT